jgi:hypothetical protein
MEMPGALYLFNLSLLAFAFATVSALVMLFRQSMGGRLSNFDVYLITSFVSLGFAIGFVAILPALVVLFDPGEALHWSIAGVIGAVCLTAVSVNLLRKRIVATQSRTPPLVLAAFATHWVTSALLLINAAVSAIRGPGLYATAVTASLFAVLWSFVRRISSLVGEQAKEDWDIAKG